MTYYNYCIYSRLSEPRSLSIPEASRYTLAFETKIRQDWGQKKKIYAIFSMLTLGFSKFFLGNVTTKEALEQRLTHFRDKVHKANQAARVIQRHLARRAFIRENKVVESALGHRTFSVSNSIVTRCAQTLHIWWKKGAVDLKSLPTGQIVWHRAIELGKHLKESGYHVFYHAHSYPITFHLELASTLASIQRTFSFVWTKPIESQRRFRAPGVARHFENTTAYLKSSLGLQINSGKAMDDHYRESIISCDAIDKNEESYESAHHFFHSNCSIVDTPTSTHQSHGLFDRKFLSSYIRDKNLLDYGVILFRKARDKVSQLPGYGMIRVIAIRPERLENEKTNYVWRSHAYGRICSCIHTPGKTGHREFVATLQKHQNGMSEKCKPSLLQPKGSFPQYRILASNIDKDPTKQIYTMDCLTKEQRNEYRLIYDSLRASIRSILRLEKIQSCKSYDELLLALSGINPKEESGPYWEGVYKILEENQRFLKDHLSQLKTDLPQSIYDLIT